MAGPVKGEWAGEEIVLNDAATETTLLALIEAVKKMEGSSAGGAGGGKAAANAINDLAKSSAGASKAIKKSPHPFVKAGGAVASAFSSVGSAAKGLGEELLIGGNTLSDFTRHITGVISEIPVFGSAIGGLSQLFVSVLDNQVDVFRNLSSAGVDFGGSLFDIQHAATRANLSLETYQQVVTTNSESLALLGGNATKGAKIFTNVSNTVQQSGERFAALGMTMEETAQYTADYLELQTRLGRAQRTDQAQLAAGAESYIMQLDKLAKVTGKQRDQIAQEMKQQAMDDRIKAMFAGMEGTQSAALTGMLSLIEGASPDIADATKEMMATGGVPVSDFAKSMQRLNPRLGEMAAGLMDGTVSQEEYLAEVRRTGAMMNDMSEEQRRMIGITAATGNTMLAANREFLGVSELGAGMEEAASAQQAAAERGSSGLLAFQRNLQDLRNVIVGRILDSGIFQNLEEGFSGIVDSVMGIDFEATLGPIIDGLTNTVKSIGRVIGTFIDDFKELGFDQAFANLWNNSLKPTLIEGWSLIVAGLSNLWKDNIAPAIKEWWAGIDFKKIIKENFKTFAVVVGGALIAAFVGIPALLTGLVVGGLAMLFGSDLWEGLKTKLSEVWTGLKEGISFVFSGVVDFFLAPVNLIKFVAEQIGNMFSPVIEFFQPAVDMIKSVGQAIQGVVEKIVNFFGDLLMEIPGAETVKNTFNAVKGFFSRGEEEAEKQESKVVEVSRRTLEGEEKIAALKESQARDREKLENEESGRERIRLRRRIRDRERVIAAEEAALAANETAASAEKENQERKQEIIEEQAAALEEKVEVPELNVFEQLAKEAGIVLDNPAMLPQTQNVSAGAQNRQLAESRSNSEASQAAKASFEQASKAARASFEEASKAARSNFAELQQNAPAVPQVDTEAISSYNRTISASLEEIKTATGGGATVTNRDGTVTRVPPEETLNEAETVEKLNTTLNQMLVEIQAGNRIQAKSLKAVKANSNEW